MDQVRSSSYVSPAWSSLEGLVNDQLHEEHPKIYSIVDSCLTILNQENSKLVVGGTTREQLETLLKNIDKISEKKAEYYKKMGFVTRVFSRFRNFVRFQEFATSDKLAGQFKLQLEEKLKTMEFAEVAKQVANNDETSLHATQEDPDEVEIGEENEEEVSESEDDEGFFDFPDNDGIDALNKADDEDFFDFPDNDGIDALNKNEAKALNEIDEDDDDEFFDALTDSKGEEESYDKKTETNQENSPRASTPDDQKKVASSVSPAASAKPQFLSPENTIWETWGKEMPVQSVYIKRIWLDVFKGAEVETWEKVPNKEGCYKLKLKNAVSGTPTAIRGDIHLNQEMTIQFSTEKKNGRSCPKITFVDEGIYHKMLGMKTPVESITFERDSNEELNCKMSIPRLVALAGRVNSIPLMPKIDVNQFTSLTAENMCDFWEEIKWKKA
jgi:hypothetical protein